MIHLLKFLVGVTAFVAMIVAVFAIIMVIEHCPIVPVVLFGSVFAYGIGDSIINKWFLV